MNSPQLWILWMLIILKLDSYAMGLKELNVNIILTALALVKIVTAKGLTNLDEPVLLVFYTY